MAYVTGTATNCVDLINKLEDFLTTNPALVAANQQWVCFKDNEVMPYSRTMPLDTSGNCMYRFFMPYKRFAFCGRAFKDAYRRKQP